MQKLELYSNAQLKALFGFPKNTLAEIILIVLPQLENNRRQRLKNRPDRRRRFVENDGRPPKALPLAKLLMSLLYLRHNTNHALIGEMFGVSADTSENAFYEVIGILKAEFPSSKWEAEKKFRREPQWKPSAVEYLIIDSFETPIARPSLNERQRRVYSGKKKRHTLKTQLITDENGEIIQVNGGFRGPKSDIEIYRATRLAKGWQEKPKIADKAYIGEKIQVPKKKPKGGELTEAEKAVNRELSQKRIRVEHSIRRVKGFRIVRDEYRLGIGLFPTVVSAVVGLIQLTRIVQ